MLVIGFSQIFLLMTISLTGNHFEEITNADNGEFSILDDWLRGNKLKLNQSQPSIWC